MAGGKLNLTITADNSARHVIQELRRQVDRLESVLRIRRGWEPGRNFYVELDDKTADDRNQDQLDKMVAEIQEVANRYGFDLDAWGGR